MKKTKIAMLALTVLLGAGLSLGIASCKKHGDDKNQDTPVVVQKTDKEKAEEYLNIALSIAPSNKISLKGSLTLPSKGRENTSIKYTIKEGQQYASIGRVDGNDQIIDIARPYSATPKDPEKIVITAEIKINDAVATKDLEYKVAYTDVKVDKVSVSDIYSGQVAVGTPVIIENVTVVFSDKGGSIIADENGTLLLVYKANLPLGSKGTISNVSISSYKGALQLDAGKGNTPKFDEKAKDQKLPEAKLVSLNTLKLPNVDGAVSISLNKEVVYTYAKVTIKGDVTMLTDPKNQSNTFEITKYSPVKPDAKLDGKLVKIELLPIAASGENQISAYIQKIEEVTEVPQAEQEMIDELDKLATLPTVEVKKEGSFDLPTLAGYELAFEHLPSTPAEEKELVNLTDKTAKVVADTVKEVTVKVNATKADKKFVSYVTFKLGQVTKLSTIEEVLSKEVKQDETVNIQGQVVGFNKYKKTVYIVDNTNYFVKVVANDKVSEFVLNSVVKVTGKKAVNYGIVTINLDEFNKVEDSKAPVKAVELSDIDTVKDNELYRLYDVVVTVKDASDKYTYKVDVNGKEIAVYKKANQLKGIELNKKYKLSNVTIETYKKALQVYLIDESTVEEVQ